MQIAKMMVFELTMKSDNGDIYSIRIPKHDLDSFKEKNKVIDIQEVEESCYGCYHNLPGQRDHMNIGGCLYQD